MKIMDFRSPNVDLTFDLHYDNDKKAEMYKLWVERVYSAANTLQMSYSELWDLPEQEFLLLENIANKIKKKQEEDRKQILDKRK